MKKKVLALMLVFVLCLSACGGDSPPNSRDITQDPTPTPSLEPAPTPSPEMEFSAIGDSVTLGNWSIAVSDFYFTDQIEDGEFFYFSPEEGSLFAVVAAQITNNGKESDTFLPSFFTSSDVQANIYYVEEYEYSASLLLMDEDLHNSTLNPLTSKSGIIVFELPQVIESSEESLVITFSAGKDEVTFSLR